MNRVVLKRVVNDADVTLGVIRLNKYIFSTLELPWKDNARNVSCIPDGIYVVSLNDRNIYTLSDVPGRYGIQIHVGNLASDIRGCILLGLRFGTLMGQPAVLNSTAANKLFKAELNHADFRIEIKTC